MLIVADVAAIVYAVRKVDGLDLIMDGLKKTVAENCSIRLKQNSLPENTK